MVLDDTAENAFCKEKPPTETLCSIKQSLSAAMSQQAGGKTRELGTVCKVCFTAAQKLWVVVCSEKRSIPWPNRLPSVVQVC